VLVTAGGGTADADQCTAAPAASQETDVAQSETRHPSLVPRSALPETPRTAERRRAIHDPDTMGAATAADPTSVRILR
jgi:hypothetical protein